MEFPRLQSRVSSSSYVPPHKTQLHPRMQPFSLSPPNSKPNNKNPHKFLLLFISISLFPFLFYLFSLYRSIHLSSKFTPPASRAYGLILHIGSSRSQIRVFQTLEMDSGTPVLGEGSESFEIPNGLSGLDPGGAERLVLELVGFAKLKVPKSEWRNTVVQLMVSGDGGADEVLEECRRVLRESDFLFKYDKASVLRGEDEAVYAWVALNYVLGSLGNKPEDTYGIVELGGSSVQITYATREPEQVELPRTIRKLPGKHYLVFRTLKIPVDEERTARNPCIPRGYEKEANTSDRKVIQLHATGNFSACRIEVLELLNRSKGECTSTVCEESLADLKEHIGSQRAFYYKSKFLEPHPMGSLFELEAAGHHFCEDHWDILKSQHHDIDDVDLSRYCFSHAYAVALLHDNLGILYQSKRVRLKSPQFDWTLGAFIHLMTEEQPHEKLGDEFRDQIVGNESVTYFFMFAVLLVGVLLAAFFVMKLRKPQMKTIYDLEKGQYIVTRVPR